MRRFFRARSPVIERGNGPGSSCARARGAARNRGASLLIVLWMVALLQLLALAQLDLASVAARGASAARDRTLAFYAADAALGWCARQHAQGLLSARPWREGGEPAAWLAPAAFDASSGVLVANIVPQGEAPVQAPQCLLEQIVTDGPAQRLLLTARGFGALPGTQVWLQALRDGDAAHPWYWRSVAGVPQ